MKKSFKVPFVLPLSGGDPTEIIGGGTGQGGFTNTPLTYEQWQQSEWYDDYIQDGTIDMYDFGAWWDACGFTFQQWQELGYTQAQWEEYVEG